MEPKINSNLARNNNHIPSMDVIAPKNNFPNDVADTETQPIEHIKQPESQSQLTKKESSSSPSMLTSSQINIAIIATVIIVLGLAMLAIYAYIKRP